MGRDKTKKIAMLKKKSRGNSEYELRTYLLKSGRPKKKRRHNEMVSESRDIRSL